jgi:hypothetical protein
VNDDQQTALVVQLIRRSAFGRRERVLEDFPGIHQVAIGIARLDDCLVHLQKTADELLLREILILPSAPHLLFDRLARRDR